MIFIAYTGLVSAWLDKIRNSFTSATINGNTIKLTKHDGTETTLTTQDITYNTATTQSDGLMSAQDKDKLNGITAGAEVNQNAFSNIKVGLTTIAADTKTDTFELVAGSNVTLTPDATSDKVTIDATDTTYDKATQSADGLLSKEDKTIIDSLDNTYAKLTGTLADNPITRTSPSGHTASLMQHGYTVGDEAEICDIGWDHANRDGAMLGLNSVSHSTLPGQFSLVARDGTNTSNLAGKPDGTLTWDGKSLVNNGTFNRMFFSQTSSSYTAPYTGIYRITLKGGGGGGGGRITTSTNSSGAGGGEGATLIFYETLTKGQSYPYVIGAGGTAGSSGSSATNGGGGGATVFNSSYTVNAGFGGANSSNVGKYGGGGGSSYAAPLGAVVHFIPGASGVSNGLVSNGGAGLSAPATGGGSGGSSNTTQPATYGGGGCGASPIYSGMDAGAGGAGYILIEYAG